MKRMEERRDGAHKVHRQYTCDCNGNQAFHGMPQMQSPMQRHEHNADLLAFLVTEDGISCCFNNHASSYRTHYSLHPRQSLRMLLHPESQQAMIQNFFFC